MGLHWPSDPHLTALLACWCVGLIRFRLWDNHCGFPDLAKERGEQHRPTYSARNAITGSTRDALSPGTQPANTAVTPSTTMMAAYVTGSLGVKSNKNVRSMRAPANAPATPMATPTATSASPSLITSHCARTDADDRPRLSIDVDGASDDRRIGVEPALPQGV